VIRLAAALAASAIACARADTAPITRAYDHPRRVTIRGYDGDAMEPFITRDGRYLFFNNLNDPLVNTNIQYASRVDDSTFQYLGEIDGIQTPALEGVPSMDRDGTLYFVSNRSYDSTLSTIYRGHFDGGKVTGVELVPGASRHEPGIVNFDVEISADGNTRYTVDSRFGKHGPESARFVIAVRRGDKFERAANSDRILANVNASNMQYAASISANGLTFFFTRERSGLGGGLSIMMATRADTAQPFGVPQRIAAIEGFVEAPAISPDERVLYFHKREGSRFVIYLVTRQP
jgi:hypothetical protein